MKPNRELENLLQSLPGVGPRQARRMIYYLLRREPSFARELSELIAAVRSGMKLCQQTFMFFYTEDAGEKLSPIARDSSRDHQRILVVETDSDLHNIEQLGIWQGTYFVLGGVAQPHNNEIERQIRISDFTRIIKDKLTAGTLSEVIIGTSATPAGDYTADLIKKTALELSQEQLSQEQSREIKITSLGRGLSTGTALEYVDNETLQQAIENRL